MSELVCGYMLSSFGRKTLGILGAGAFGTALSMAWCEKFDVTLFSCFGDHVNSMKSSRINEFFKDFKIPNTINISTTSELMPGNFDYLFWVFPIKPTSEILEELKDRINGTPIIICSKGLLPDSSYLFDFFEGKLPNSDVFYLSGPNFSFELASKEKISMADFASRNLDLSTKVALNLSTPLFKLNPIDDVIGIQLCGALKNIMAIASGIVKGLDLGKNAEAALITRAICEMKTFGKSLGAKDSTFYGLCGVGDLILTASSPKSRNTNLGIEIALGKFNGDIENNKTCEGFDTISQIIDIAKRNNMSLPICEQVYRIIFHNNNPKSIIDVFNK